MPFDGTFFQITKEELIQNLNDDIKKKVKFDNICSGRLEYK